MAQVFFPDGQVTEVPDSATTADVQRMVQMITGLGGVAQQLAQPAAQSLLPRITPMQGAALGFQGVQQLQQQTAQRRLSMAELTERRRAAIQQGIEREKDRAQELKLAQQAFKNEQSLAKLRADLEVGTAVKKEEALEGTASGQRRAKAEELSIEAESTKLLQAKDALEFDQATKDLRMRLFGAQVEAAEMEPALIGAQIGSYKASADASTARAEALRNPQAQIDPAALQVIQNQETGAVSIVNKVSGQEFPVDVSDERFAFMRMKGADKAQNLVNETIGSYVKNIVGGTGRLTSLTKTDLREIRSQLEGQKNLGLIPADFPIEEAMAVIIPTSVWEPYETPPNSSTSKRGK